MAVPDRTEQRSRTIGLRDAEACPVQGTGGNVGSAAGFAGDEHGAAFVRQSLNLVSQLQHRVALTDHVVDAAREEPPFELLILGDEVRATQGGEDRSAKFVAGHRGFENFAHLQAGRAELIPLSDGRQHDELRRLMMLPGDPLQVGDMGRHSAVRQECRR